ncbi:caffeoyl-CoA O-methyltransferase [Streptoalloteichus tenebrarius]|uniref:Caffeoyl-CoA O-methyltransferase n=1 Tax=Streptoalloteichus tenebrarius (strain ATCC 17920 / DSM 40477 / JCM 4838 / CBS 697.72 / NBRC 16177 / NCIMB 11028 / NRRL B-12390 / A12253. 1 / ISP 5477) TaxID=1933 RepID=A0ABT1HVB3_STRSD|nr:O-methyltransferase [Streptoalloteichus tenebrarius]MCP2259474.1 caffeoyl-CoA O-methyltransferase [Streptoalloteichus tenebrarius]BFF01448.1 class I SAM-dependent methyltransferase [Streptoalloteichus tenebrarius]
MSKISEGLSPELHEYLVAHGTPPDQLLRDLADETALRLPERFAMQIAPEQGTFLTLLTRLLGVRSAVEVGTFTGYSSICIARGLAPGGRLLCCDVSEEFTSVARRYWSMAGLDDRVELRLAPAVETLRSLPAEPTVDLSFIDADKTGYVDYWEELVPRTRQGGVILVDNVFSGGRVLQEEPEDEVVRAIQEFNEHALADPRVELVMLPIADGLTLARKL